MQNVHASPLEGGGGQNWVEIGPLSCRMNPQFICKVNIYGSQSLQLVICVPRNVRVKPISTNSAQCRGPMRKKYGIYVKPSFFTWAIFTATKAFFFYYADKRLFFQRDAQQYTKAGILKFCLKKLFYPNTIFCTPTPWLKLLSVLGKKSCYQRNSC